LRKRKIPPKPFDRLNMAIYNNGMEQQKKSPGRPKERVEAHVKTTVELPVSLIDRIDQIKGSRTWREIMIAALQAWLAEQEEKEGEKEEHASDIFSQ